MTDPAEILTRLEDMLNQQVDLAKREKFQAVMDLSKQVDVLLALTKAFPPATLNLFRAHIERIRKLHSQVHLILTQQKQSCAQKRGQMHKGKKVLRAYGR